MLSDSNVSDSVSGLYVKRLRKSSDDTLKTERRGYTRISSGAHTHGARQIKRGKGKIF